jgi:tRNA A-37 threonylcarbamoyl transferase component Bud32
MERHTRLLKRDTHSRVGLLEIRQQPCFLKLYLAKSAWQQLGFRLGYGRGIRSFDSASALARARLAVPVPRACLLVPGGLLLLTDAIAQSRDLRALWLAPTPPQQLAQCMTGAGRALAALHRAGFAHGDCKWSNLLWNGEVLYLVDLEAVRKVGYAAAAALSLRPRQWRDLARFTIDAEELGLGPEHYEIFLASYCVAAGLPRGALAAGIKAAAEPLRRLHAKKYGGAHTPLC